MQVSGATVAKIAVAAAAVGVVWYVSRKASETVSSAGKAIQVAVNAVSPFNDENIFYTAVNDAGASLTGDQNFNLGSAIYDATHLDQSSGGINDAFDSSKWQFTWGPLMPIARFFGAYDPNYTGTGGRF